MKRIILYTILLCSALIANAQTINVHKTDGTTEKFESYKINHVELSGNDGTQPLITIYDTTMNPIGSFETGDFDYLDFASSEPSTQYESPEERSALIALYNSTDGPNWTHHENWGSDKPISQWYGVKVNHDGYVYLLDLPNNNLKGTIPSEIGLLEKLNYLELNLNHLSGEIPESIVNIENLCELTLSSNDFTGEIPSWLGKLKNLAYLFLDNNSFTGAIPESIGDMEKLELLLLDYNQLSGTIPCSLSNLKSIRQLAFMHNQLTGVIPDEIGLLKTLTSFTIYDNHITGNIPSTMANLTNLEILNVGMNEMDGTIPEEVTMSEMWSNSSHYIKQREGHELKVGKIYESDDFSHNGDVSLLQTHTKGNGIALVLTGSGYSDRKVADGSFMNDMKKAYERFFEVEPYKSFKDYFDVYCITTVSRNEFVGGTNIAYGIDLFDDQIGGFNYSYDGNEVIGYLNRIDALKQNYENVTMLIVVNDKYAMAKGECFYWADDFAVALIDNSEENAGGIQHEAGGHGFAKLADEYVIYWKDSYSVYPESDYPLLDESHANGYELNIDYHNDNTTVLWRDFLNDDNYEVENLGIYEGGLANYQYGVYRPSLNSVMNDPTLYCGYFNAPSRWAIYQRIMKLAGEDCKFEDFLEYDKKNLKAMMIQPVRGRAAKADKIRPRGNHIHDAHPIRYNYPSSEIVTHSRQ